MNPEVNTDWMSLASRPFTKMEAPKFLKRNYTTVANLIEPFTLINYDSKVVA